MCLHISIQRLIGGQFHDPPQHVKAGQRRIARSSSRLKIEEQSAVFLALRFEAFLYSCILFIYEQSSDALLQPRGVAQQIADRDLPNGRHSFDPVCAEEQQFGQQGEHVHSLVPLVALVRYNAQRSEGRQPAAHRIVQAYFALLDLLHHRCRRDGFCHAHHAIDRVFFYRPLCGNVRPAPSVFIDKLTVPAHQQRAARDLLVIQITLYGVVYFPNIHYS